MKEKLFGGKLKISSHREHFVNFIWRAFQIGSKQATVAVILFIAAKYLDKETFGIYNYHYAFIMLFTLLADFGISKSVVKYMAEYNLADKSRLHGIFSNALLVLLSLSVFFSCVILLFSRQMIGESHYYIYYLIPMLFFMPLSSLYDGAFSGLKKFKAVSVISMSGGVISIASAFVLITTYGITGAFITINLYYALILVMSVFAFGKVKISFDKALAAKIGKYSFLVGLAGFGTFMYSKASSIILGQFGYFTETGYFEIIDKIFVMITFPALIFSQVISPRAAELSAAGDFEKIRKYFTRLLLTVFAGSVVLSAVMYAVLPFAVELFLNKYYTPDFINMFELMIINLPFQLTSVMLAQPFIISTGEAKYSLLTIPFGLANIGLAVGLTYAMGFMGVIIASVFTSVLNKVITYYLIYAKFNRKAS